jgi:hypothetical protein
MTEGSGARPPRKGSGPSRYDAVLSHFVDTPVAPRTYFNANILCRGEVLKSVVGVPGGLPVFESSEEGPRPLLPELRVFHAAEDLSETIAQRRHFQRITRDDQGLYGVTIRERWGAMMSTQELAETGSYVAQVYDLPGGQGAALGERVVHVLEPWDYDAFWRRLFGEDWDDPIWWDSMEEAQGEELVRGLAGDALLEPPFHEISWDGRSIYRHFGAIVAACMVGDLGPLPFEVWPRRTSTQPEMLPHVDLTKLMWLLRVLAPAWADACFFSPSLGVGCEAIGNDAVSITFYPVTTGGGLHLEGAYDVPRLDGLVREAIGEEHHLSLEWPVEGSHYSLTYAQGQTLENDILTS